MMTPVSRSAARGLRSVGPLPYYGTLARHWHNPKLGNYSKDSGSGEVWWHIYDEAVSTVRHEDMLGAFGHGSEAERAGGCWCGYTSAPIQTR